MTEEEKMDYFYNALCNGIGQLNCYGITIKASKKEYAEAKKSLQEKNPTHLVSYEEVYIEILNVGGSLTAIDLEGTEDDCTITKADVIERMDLVPINTLLEMANEQDDAGTADTILQCVFFKEEIYG